MINNGSSPLTNTTLYNTPGTYNITVVYPATENYSSSQETHFIIVEDTTVHFSISNCRLETNGQWDAIVFTNVENGRVENCEVVDAAIGITINDSRNISVENTTIYSSSYSIYLNDAMNSTISNCNVFYNNQGIVLTQTDHCQIRNNLIYGNWHHGIEIHFSSHNNSVYGNSIGWNAVSSQYFNNAVDDGGDNSFDDNITVGNFWSDFNESEEYMISGDANSVDSFAQILHDNVSPILEPLYDTAIDVESVDNTLTWQAYDEFPWSYAIRENEIERIVSVWTGGAITFGLDHLPVGTHAIRIIVSDGAGNTTSDEVLVAVISFVLGGIGTELVMIASGITVTSFVIAVILIKRLS